MKEHLTRLMSGIGAERFSTSIDSVAASLRFDKKIARLDADKERRERDREMYRKRLLRISEKSIQRALAKPGLIDLDVARSFIKQAERHVELRKYLPDVADRVYDENMKRNRRTVFERLSKMAGEYLKLEKMRREHKS